MGERTLKLEWVQAKTLKENPANWRRHPEGQLKALEDLIRDPEIGWAGALLWNSTTSRIIDGHGRLKIVDPEEYVPVLVGAWSEEKEREILLSLDPLAGLAIPDPVALRALLDSVELGTDALKALGAGLEEQLATLVAEQERGREVIEDDVPDAGAVETRCKPGDLWKLGEHRLLCGDSTKAEDVGRLMGGEKAGLCFTSPPYGQQREYEGGIGDWDILMRGVFGNLPMTDDGQVLVNLGLIHRGCEWIPYWDGWVEWMRQVGWRRFGWYVWDQGPGLPGDWSGRLAPAFEFVFHFNRNAMKPAKWVDKQPESIQINDHGTGFRGKDGKTPGDMCSPELSLQTTKIPDSVIRVCRHKARGIEMAHPAVFSVGLVDYVAKSWQGLMYEPFAGSGTTLIAAEQLNRRCFGIEIAPKYCDVILARWEKFVGKTAERI
jgi:DNA modification methylase